MKKSLVKMLSIILGAVIVTPTAALAKDYSYKTSLVKQDFSACDSFEDTGFIGDSTGTLDGTGESPWYIEEDENGVKCLAADLTASSIKAYLAIGNEDWENYTVSVSFVMTTPGDMSKSNGVSLYTRSRGIIHTYGTKSCSYFRYRFSNPANYSNYFCCWVKQNDGANESVYDNNWYDRTANSTLEYGVMQTITASVENTPTEDGKVSVKQTVTLNDTFSSTKTKTYAASSPLVSGKAALEFLEQGGGHVRIYDISVVGSITPSIKLTDDVPEEGKTITAQTSVSESAEREINPVLINAAYENGVLNCISTDKADFSEEKTAELTAGVQSPSAGGCVSAMLWNGVSSAEALSESNTIGSLESIYEADGMNFDADGVLHAAGTVTAGDTVNILITNPDTDINMLDSADDSTLLNSICCIYQLKADENGKFSIAVKPNLTDGSQYGEYKAYIKADNGDCEVLSAALQNPDLLRETVEEFNGKSFVSDAAIKEYVDSKAEIFGIDLSQLNAIQNTAAVYRALADNRPYNTENPEIANVFNSAVLYQTFNEAEGKDMLDFINSHSEIFDLTSMVNYNEYINLSDEDKLKLMSYLNALKPVSGFDGVVKCIDTNTILYIIAGKEYTWNGIYEILYKYKDYLGLDFTSYNRLSETQRKNIMTSLNSRLKTINDVTEIKTIFDSLVAAAAVSTPPSGGGGSSGGGSSSSKSSSSGVSMPLIVDRFDNERAAETPLEILVSERFSDLQGYDWACESIEYLAEKEIIEGSEGMFYPQDSVTREQFVKMIVNAFALNDEGAQCGFEDVEQTEWYYPYIASAVSAGIINGIDDKSFGVGTDITREQLAVIIYRYIVSSGTRIMANSSADDFADSGSVSEYAREAVAKLHEIGIINGDAENRFNPSSSATRAEAAVIIYRLINAPQASEEEIVSEPEQSNEQNELSSADEMQAQEKETGELLVDDAGQLIKAEGEE